MVDYCLIASSSSAWSKAMSRTVFSDAVSFDNLGDFDAENASAYVHDNGYAEDDIDNVVIAKDASGQDMGYVVTVTSHAGYGGDITFHVGINKEGTINGYSITSISETAGLGMKATDMHAAPGFVRAGYMQRAPEERRVWI